MPDIGGFLRYALHALGAPSDVHYQEYLDAINEAFPPPPEPEPAPAGEAAADDLAAARARVAELEAQLADQPAGM